MAGTRDDRGTPPGDGGAAVSRVRSLAAAGAAVLAAAGLVTATPAGAADSEWSRVALPRIRPLATLTSVDAGSATRAWAVGREYAGTTDYGEIPGVPLILAMNGSRWTKAVLPAATWNGSLTSVAATGPAEAWAAGQESGGRGHVLRWNGSAWAEVALPDAVATGHALTLEGTPGYAPWLVARSTQDGAVTVLRWSGSAWAAVATPAAPFYTRLVDVAPDGTVRLVGAVSTQLPGLPLFVPVLTVYRWSGSAWEPELVDGPRIYPTDVLAGPGGELWVAGQVPWTGPGRPPPVAQAMLVRHDGAAWTTVPLGTGTVLGTPTLTGREGGRPEYVLGTFVIDAAPVAGALRNDGGTWTRVPFSPGVPPETDQVSVAAGVQLPGTSSTVAVGQVQYSFYGQYAPRIEREDR
jgi:hypothetical protein